jgi:alanine racemase
LRSWVEISLKQIAHNYRTTQQCVGAEVGIMPVIKADAYNHGAVQVARTLMREGVLRLAVSSVEEAVELREAGIHASIILLGGVLPDESEAICRYGVTPVLHSPDDIYKLNATATSRGVIIPYHIKIDSGLARLGTRAACSEIAAAVRSAGMAVLEGLMTHLASAEDFTITQTDEQISSFLQTVTGLRACGVDVPLMHVSSSNAIVYGRRTAWQTIVRPGLCLYGYVSPAMGSPSELLVQPQPALTWKASVLAVKHLPKGVPIGYNGRYRTSRPTRMAVIAAGYADGYPHQLGNRGKVIVKGFLAPIIGAVSMDLITVDITDCPEVVPGDPVILLGRENGTSMDAHDLAGIAGTIPYAILCGIGKRVHRQYLD